VELAETSPHIRISHQLNTVGKTTNFAFNNLKTHYLFNRALITLGVQKCSKNVTATSEFKAPEWWHETSSILIVL
jgi:hypothetical protein